MTPCVWKLASDNPNPSRSTERPAFIGSPIFHPSKSIRLPFALKNASEPDFHSQGGMNLPSTEALPWIEFQARLLRKIAGFTAGNGLENKDGHTPLSSRQECTRKPERPQ